MKTKTFKVENVDGLEVVNLDEEVEQEAKHRKGLPWITIASIALGITFVVGGGGALLTHAGDNNEQAVNFAKGTDEEEAQFKTRKLAILTDIRTYAVSAGDIANPGAAMYEDPTTGEYKYIDENTVKNSGHNSVPLMSTNIAKDGPDDVTEDFWGWGEFAQNGNAALAEPSVTTDYIIVVDKVYNDSDGKVWAAVVRDYTMDEDGNITSGTLVGDVRSAELDANGRARFNQLYEGLGTNEEGTVPLTLMAKVKESEGSYKWFKADELTDSQKANVEDYKYETDNALVLIYTEEDVIKNLVSGLDRASASETCGLSTYEYIGDVDMTLK